MDETERDESDSPQPESSSPFAFVNITHPDQSKDSRVLKTVRQKAMQSYLAQSSSSPSIEYQPNRVLPYQRYPLDPSMETQLAHGRGRRANSAPEDDGELAQFSSDAEEMKPSSSRSTKSLRSSTAMGLRTIRPYMSPEAGSSSGRQRSEDSDRNQLQLLKYNWKLFFGSEELESSWQKLGSEDQLFNYSAICISARHTDALKQNIRNPESKEIYEEVVSNLNQRLQQPSERTSDMTIAITLHICLSELYTPERQVDWCHFLQQLLEVRGGIRTLSFSPPALSRAALMVPLLSAVIYETPPIDSFYFAAIESLPDPNYIQALESPLCHPEGGFGQIPSSTNSIPRLIELLDCVRQALDIACSRRLDPAVRWHHVQLQKQHTRKQLLEFKSMPKNRIRGQEKERAHIFDACRLTVIIVERALFYSTPLSKAVTGAQEGIELLYRLQKELLQTSLDLCWDELAGVLLWVSLVGAAAANGIQSEGEDEGNLRAWFVGCAVRVILKYAFKHPAEILTALCTFRRLQEVCTSHNSSD